MRKQRIEDDSIKGMLRDEYDRCLNLVEQLQRTINSYPRGHLIVKKIKSKGRVYEYHHLQWREGKKIVSRHISEKEILEVQKKIEQREAYQSNYLKFKKRLEYLAPLLGEKKPARKSMQLESHSLTRITGMQRFSKDTKTKIIKSVNHIGYPPFL